MLSTSRRADFAEEYINEKLSDLSEMTYVNFYGYCASVLVAEGYTDVKVARDFGITGMHVWASKDDINYAVICTRTKTAVTCQPVQQAMGACSIHKGVQPMVMSTGLFSKNAVKFARESTPPVFLYNRDNFFDHRLQQIMRVTEHSVKENAQIVQNLTSFIKYTSSNGNRTCILKRSGVDSVRAAKDALENVWHPNLRLQVTDIFDLGLSVAVSGVKRQDLDKFLWHLFTLHGNMGFFWVMASRVYQCITIGMPQIASRIPVTGYYL